MLQPTMQKLIAMNGFDKFATFLEPGTFNPITSSFVHKQVLRNPRKASMTSWVSTKRLREFSSVGTYQTGKTRVSKFLDFLKKTSVCRYFFEKIPVSKTSVFIQIFFLKSICIWILFRKKIQILYLVSVLKIQCGKPKCATPENPQKLSCSQQYQAGIGLKMKVGPSSFKIFGGCTFGFTTLQ